MSRLKIIVAAAAVSLSCAGSGYAHPSLAHTFAECAGRYSAEIEHAWLMNDPAARTFEADRAAFVGLTTATMTPDQGRSVLSHRIEVKLAHAALLQQATFGQTLHRSQAARHVANRYLATCRRLLLGS